jgi:hypothetical protein
MWPTNSGVPKYDYKKAVYFYFCEFWNFNLLCLLDIFLFIAQFIPIDSMACTLPLIILEVFW